MRWTYHQLIKIARPMSFRIVHAMRTGRRRAPIANMNMFCIWWMLSQMNVYYLISIVGPNERYLVVRTHLHSPCTCTDWVIFIINSLRKKATKQKIKTEELGIVCNILIIINISICSVLHLHGHQRRKLKNIASIRIRMLKYIAPLINNNWKR